MTDSPEPSSSASPSLSPGGGTETTQSPPPAESPTDSGTDTPAIDPGTPVLTPPPAVTATPDTGTQDGPPEGIPLL